MPGTALAGLALLTATAAGTDDTSMQTVQMVYLKQATEALPKLSNLNPPPEDDGALGGLQGIEDNNTTGMFLRHHYELESIVLDIDDDVHKTFQDTFDRGVRQFILDIGGSDLLTIADSERGQQAWFYNVGVADDLLRTQQCRRNILHIAPSYSMRADALAQYLVSKRWNKWFVIVGRRKSDLNFAAAVRRAAKKFGGKIMAEKAWEYGPDMRRTAASTIPLFTQNVDYHVLVVADVVGEFGEYLMYRTWDPRPVAGTQGLTPVSWHKSHEQWGSAQIQSRFLRNHGRYMSEKDYQVWAATRVIGEAVTRSASTDAAEIAKYVRSDSFELAGYKGQKMTFRRWNLQLRQPLLLAWPTSLVSVSPQRQFLHARSTLDTMGYDKQESACTLDAKP